jgi:hypothetical protein
VARIGRELIPQLFARKDRHLIVRQMPLKQRQRFTKTSRRGRYDAMQLKLMRGAPYGLACLVHTDRTQQLIRRQPDRGPTVSVSEIENVAHRDTARKKPPRPNGRRWHLFIKDRLDEMSVRLNNYRVGRPSEIEHRERSRWTPATSGR